MKVLIEFSFVYLLLCTIGLTAQNNQTSSCVLLKNELNTLPIKDLERTQIAFVNLGEERLDVFQNTLNRYTTVKEIQYNSFNASTLKPYDYVIYGLAGKQINWEFLYKLAKLSPNTRTIAVSFGSLKHYEFNNFLFDSDVLLQETTSSVSNQLHAASLIFGGSTCSGRLGKTIANRFHKGDGVDLHESIRLGYALAETKGLDSEYIHQKVDSIMEVAIEQQAFPGAQLLVAKDQSIIYHKSFGFHTYDSINKVSNSDLYDLASVTKISGPLPVLMQLVDQGKIKLDEKFSTYWKPWRHRKDKKDLSVRAVLAHQAGLQPYYVFLQEVLREGKFKRRFVRNKQSKRFPTEIYDGLFIRKNFPKKMYRILNRSEVSPVKKYKYSGLSFMLYPKLIEQMIGVPYEKHLRDSIYRPLGANNFMFNPDGKYPDSLIVPTENDTFYRKTLVKGWVHDENASLIGGVSGNAGLFGTAEDLAKLMYMYQSMGAYAGKRFISEKTLKTFTTVQFPENGNKRGLGFDKPLLGNSKLDISNASPAPEVSPESFGHGGFTGTYVWADPKHHIVFIFLSNRVYPNRSHNKLYQLNVRPSLQQVFYKAMIDNSK